ncbi:MAG: hypothetical protein JJ896_13115 [Rhodothermales bacterium]|nr:hypothetical protein [Rhodothermales bacterium]MBO6780586.1 hypothetical protein [Rhodothermales bacterium]
MASSTAFVSGASGQARLQPDTARLRAAAGVEAAGAAAGTTFRRLARPHYNVVALRVEFQPDTTRFTTGDGTFAGPLFTDGMTPSIDPLPHNEGYFSAHLAFLEDYVARVSDGQTVVDTWLLPGVVRVSGTMGDYSPTGPDSDSDAELAKLARLSTEAWSMADPAWFAGLPALSADNTAFLILHAGVGRDLELVGTTLDKTPEDLPSLYFDQAALDRLDPRARPSVLGVPVNHGIIVPRTETRQGFNALAGENFLAEFSVNGLLAASFFNYLGVPDLFDTKTGKSAIGPFGLMDGLGIFAFSGLFPPEPTAWTKYYLGWADPVEMVPGFPIRLSYAGDPSGSDQARASISPAEYFLVENRHRDPEQDGVRMQVWKDGVVSEVRFPNGDETFNSATVSGFPGGVVVSVDQYDFALPGGKDEDNVPLIGGALIWHIDERVIAANLADNSVNADAGRRGVDLEEADGAQDIGFPVGGLFGPSFDLGSPFDFWYEGNPVVTITSSGREVSLYQNRFGPDTQPAATANDGGPGFVELSGFSAPGREMTVSFARPTQSGLVPLGTVQVPSPESSFVGPSVVRFVGLNGLLAWSARQGVLSLFADNTEIGRLEGLSAAEPAIAGNAIWAFGPVDGGVAFRGVTGGGGVIQGPTFGPGVYTEATTPVVGFVGPRGTGLAVGVDGPMGPLVLSSNGMQPQPAPVLGIIQLSATRQLRVLTSEVRDLEDQVQWTFEPVNPQSGLRPQFASDREGLMGVVPDPESSSLRMLLPDGTSRSFSVRVDGRFEGPISGRVALADVDNDGLLDALVPDEGHLWAFSRTGAVARGFPIRLRQGIVGFPIVLESAEDADAITILAVSRDGQLDAYQPGTDRQPDGFPLSVGTAAGAGPAFRLNDEAPERVHLAVLSGDGQIVSFGTNRFGLLRGPRALGNLGNSSYGETAPFTTTLLETEAVLVPGETYNWPNPIRDGVTRFRVFPTVDCAISVRILDASGREIDTLELDMAPAEVPSELEWRTDAESGVYFARVRATSTDGRTEDQLIKVAVMR